MGICCTTPEYKPPRHRNKPCVRMCSSGNHFPNFADIGDTVVLFVDFGKDFKPFQDHSLGGATAGWVWPDRRKLDDGEEQYEIKLAGLQAFLKKINPKDLHCTSFRSEAKILMTDDVLRDPGGLVKFIVPYCNSDGEQLGVVTEEDIEYDPNHRVFNHPLWDELIVHNAADNEGITQEIRRRRSSRALVKTTYGAEGQQRHSLREAAELTDQVDAAAANASVVVLTAMDEHEHDPLLGSPAPRAKRYWPDSWEMSCWRPCCDPILRSRNCFTRFLASFFVAPLTNVTGFSLYYQLYLAEIFHQRFLTKLGHYLFMPLIVMTMMTFFAHWRFDGCYTLVDTEVLILNGTAVMAIILMIWYIIWGIIQKMPCMGLFMMVPMFIMYVLANIAFQMALKSSPHNFDCKECCNFINAFKICWYYNPGLWVIVLCFGQAFSHIFEPKIPPRVNRTAHWMSCTDIFKKFGYSKSFVILMSQAVFGTIDELLASPRLLPLLMLRVCFTLGYCPKEWKVLNILVEKSLQYGDPALDYIGTGGAENRPEDAVMPDASISNSGITGEALNSSANTGYNIGKLKRQFKEMESTLTDDHHKILSDPRTLKHSVDDWTWLERYIRVRHCIAKYELQVHAYGPFRTEKQDAQHHTDHSVQRDNERMERDFPINRHRSFRNFLRQVRFHLWMMEDEMITKRALSACCENEL